MFVFYLSFFLSFFLSTMSLFFPSALISYFVVFFLLRFLNLYLPSCLSFCPYHLLPLPYTGWRNKNGTVYILWLSSDQQLSVLPRWIEHMFLIIIRPRSLNLVENFYFYFYEYLLMERSLSGFVINRASGSWKSGKSPKWQFKRNYS